MKRSVLRAACALFSLAAAVPGHAATINEMKLDNGMALLVTGEIKAGDAAKFRAEAAKFNNAFVLLESNGGALAEALEIGEAIRLKGYATAVFNGSACNSACALIWLAGTPRMLSKSARIGFHAAYTDASGSQQESGMANAMVGRYLTLLNLPESALLFATSAPPSELTWLTASNAGQSGIDVKVMGDVNWNSSETANSPQPAPAVATISAPPVAASGISNRWQLVSTDAVGNKTFLDVTSVVRNGSTRTTWERFYYAKTEQDGTAYTLTHWRYNCDARTFAVLVSVQYRGDGSIINTTQVPASQIEPHDIAPDTTGETMLNRVCH